MVVNNCYSSYICRGHSHPAFSPTCRCHHRRFHNHIMDTWKSQYCLLRGPVHENQRQLGPNGRDHTGCLWHHVHFEWPFTRRYFHGACVGLNSVGAGEPSDVITVTAGGDFVPPVSQSKYSMVMIGKRTGYLVKEFYVRGWTVWPVILIFQTYSVRF